MAIIQSGATADLLTIDPTSKAARVTLYNTDGVAASTALSGSYVAPVNIRQTAATGAGGTVWAMRNGSARDICIRGLELAIIFDGSSSSVTVKYELARFSGATPTGGAAITIIKKKASYPPSSVVDIRFLDTGLTTTGVTFATSFFVIGLPISASAVSRDGDPVFKVFGEEHSCFVLEANEGLCIRLTNAAVIGQGLTGMISWDERCPHQQCLL
jgi:hypothetical protein